MLRKYPRKWEVGEEENQRRRKYERKQKKEEKLQVGKRKERKAEWKEIELKNLISASEAKWVWEISEWDGARGGVKMNESKKRGQEWQVKVEKKEGKAESKNQMEECR